MILAAESGFDLQLTATQFWGIPLAILGAVLMSLGTQYQNRGVNKVGLANHDDGHGGLSLKSIKNLLSRPSWVIGSLLLLLAGIPQVLALAIAPLIVVQPIGAVALIVTAILNAKMSNIRLNKESILGVTLAVVGVAVFVSVAAFTAKESRVTDEQLLNLVFVLIGVSVALGILFLLFRKKFGAISYITVAGIIYGVAAVLTKVVMLRVFQLNFEPLTIICLVALVVCIAVGMYFVQTAHASGPPDMVIAGLTVIDPLAAILITVLILGEAENAPWQAQLTFVIAGAIAIIGVLLLSKYHPQTGSLARKVEESKRATADLSELVQEKPMTNPADKDKSESEKTD